MAGGACQPPSWKKSLIVILFEPPFPESRAYWAVFTSWFGAQLIKFVRARFSEKRYNLGWMIKTGGMPSAHSSLFRAWPQ